MHNSFSFCLRAAAACLFTLVSSALQAQQPLEAYDERASMAYQAFLYGSGEVGAKRMEMLVTEAPWLETSLGIGFNAAAHINQGTPDLANQSEFSLAYTYAFNNTWGAVIAAPLVINDPVFGTTNSGVGDLEVGLRYVFFGRETGPDGQIGATSPFVRATVEKDRATTYRGYGIGASNPLIMTLGFDVTTPTGNADRGLGEGHATLEPVLLSRLLLDEEGKLSLFGEARLALPTAANESNAFIYNVAASYRIDATENGYWFRYLSPLIELNGVTAADGESVVNLTPGLRWVLAEFGVVGVGYSFPVSPEEEFDSRFFLSYILDLPNGRAASQWQAYAARQALMR